MTHKKEEKEKEKRKPIVSKTPRATE